jgi:hypothetical protein
MNNDYTKICSKCKIVKSLSDFHKNKYGKDGLANQCKICRYKEQKKYQSTKGGKKTYERYIKSKKGKLMRMRSRERYEKTEKGKLAVKRSYELFKKRNPLQIKAKNAINNAIRRDKFPKPNQFKCSLCKGKSAEHWHHFIDYTEKNKFSVIPLCNNCHRTIHSRKI